VFSSVSLRRVIPLRIWVAAAVAALVFLSCIAAQAASPHVTARAYLVENPVTGEVLVQHAAWTRVPIASLTKLMTIQVALAHTTPDTVVSVDPAVTSVGESTVHLLPGERISVRDLLKAALIQSANDAAYALAAHDPQGVPGFIAKMNAKAVALGAEAGNRWDYVALVYYPTLSAFTDMMTSPDYEALSDPHRRNGCAEHVIICTHEAYSKFKKS